MSMPPYDVSADGPMAAAAAASAATAASNTPTRTGSPSQHHMHHHHHHSHQNHNHHHSSHPSSSSTPIPTSSSPSSSHDHPPSHNPQQPSSKLKLEEQRIDLKVRHHLNRDDHRKKQKRFKRTVMTVHAIVSLKLYKSKASSLEAYFRDAWKISRAQVYRFLDCAVVLNQLDGFEEQPCRERLCRSLKRLAKNRTDVQKLWESVLARVKNDHESVTSTIISSVWRELLEKGVVTGKPATSEEAVPVDPDVGALSDLEMGISAGLDEDDRGDTPEETSSPASTSGSHSQGLHQPQQQHQQQQQQRLNVATPVPMDTRSVSNTSSHLQQQPQHRHHHHQPQLHHHHHQPQPQQQPPQHHHHHHEPQPQHHPQPHHHHHEPQPQQHHPQPQQHHPQQWDTTRHHPNHLDLPTDLYDRFPTHTKYPSSSSDLTPTDWTYPPKPPTHNSPVYDPYLHPHTRTPSTPLIYPTLHPPYDPYLHPHTLPPPTPSIYPSSSNRHPLEPAPRTQQFYVPTLSRYYHQEGHRKWE